jgi:hypothetical protein
MNVVSQAVTTALSVTRTLVTPHARLSLLASGLARVARPAAPQPSSRSHDATRTRRTRTELGGTVYGGSQALLVRDLVFLFVLSALVVLAWTISFSYFYCFTHVLIRRRAGRARRACNASYFSPFTSSRDFKPSPSTSPLVLRPLASYSLCPSRAIVTGCYCRNHCARTRIRRRK